MNSGLTQCGRDCAAATLAHVNHTSGAAHLLRCEHSITITHQLPQTQAQLRRQRLAWMLVNSGNIAAADLAQLAQAYAGDEQRVQILYDEINMFN